MLNRITASCLLALCAGILSLGCAHGGKKTQATGTQLSEDHPGYYEPEMYEQYHDKRYEKDSVFDKYYEWKKK